MGQTQHEDTFEQITQEGVSQEVTAGRVCLGIDDIIKSDTISINTDTEVLILKINVIQCRSFAVSQFRGLHPSNTAADEGPSFPTHRSCCLATITWQFTDVHVKKQPEIFCYFNTYI